MAQFFWTTTILSSVVLVIASLAFIALRRRYPQFYQPKCYSKERWAPKEGTGAFWWVKTVFSYEESTLLQSAGIDVVAYLRLLKYTFMLFTVLSIVGMVIILPTNYFGTSSLEVQEHNSTTYSAEEQYSISHLKNGSETMWVHLLFTFIFSFCVFYYLQKLYLTCIDIQRRNPSHKSVTSSTVMVFNLPANITSQDKLRDMFEDIFGKGRVLSVHMIPDLAELVDLQKMRDTAFKHLKRAQDLLREKKVPKRPTHRIGTLGLIGMEVDSIGYYTRELEYLDKEILARQSGPLEMKNAGFVTFNSVATAMQCAQTLLANDLDLDCALAPLPSDIEWHRFYVSNHEYFTRTFVVYAILGVVFAFWSVPVIILSSFTRLDQIRKIAALSFIATLADENGLVKDIVEGVLPSIALNIFLVLLPFILKFVTRHRKFLMKSRHDRFLMKVLWLFLIVNVFLLSVFAAGFIDAFEAIFNDLSEVPARLANSLPKRALYLHNYMVFEGFVGYSVFFLCRLDDWILYKIKSLFSKTEADKRAALLSPPFDFPVQTAREQMIFAVGLSYSLINPLILPFCTMYFGLAWFTAKYNFVFVHTPPYAGVHMTQLVIDRTFIALFIFQLTMIGMFALKAFPYGVSILALLIFTPVFYYYLYQKYRRHADYLPLTDCPKLPEQTEEDLINIHTLYMHPVLKIPENYIQTLGKSGKQEDFVPLESLDEYPNPIAGTEDLKDFHMTKSFDVDLQVDDTGHEMAHLGLSNNGSSAEADPALAPIVIDTLPLRMSKSSSSPNFKL
eukprot:TRINITY_DN2438_c0_g2_i2.p1 TRINITY_DN2438_c0_g2~~TRINITY_DN2438_c0_g2_i2.p1  ORF type:complete len:786 (-),score=145.12 TRINITY_DN2438_c0_g2_i2:855-3212(-)